MTPAEWGTVEAELASPWGTVQLQCDQFKLRLQVHKVGHLRYTVMPYVDGVFKGIWCSAKNPCEQQRRFMRPASAAAYKPAELKRMKGLYSAKQLHDMAAKRFEYFKADWPAFKPLKRHLIKHNQVITLVLPQPAATSAAPATSALAEMAAAVATH